MIENPRRGKTDTIINSFLGVNKASGLDSREPECPECKSSNIVKDGTRRINHAIIQRYLCKDCHYRFGESSNPIESEIINSYPTLSSNRQIGVSNNGMKNLVQKAEVKEAIAGKSTQLSNQQIIEIQQKILEFEKYLKREGYAEITQSHYLKEIRLLVKRGANLLDPENVKDVIAEQNWVDSRKRGVCCVYDAFLKSIDKTWKKPRYKVQDTIPFCPHESTIDQIIAGAGKKISIVFQVIKETGCRSGECDKLEWSQINFENRTITIRPLKGSRLRVKKVSRNLIDRLQSLSREARRVFGNHDYNAMRTNWSYQRKRLATVLKNPEIEKVTFCSVRHWYATKLYHETRNILVVQRDMGHRSINSTMHYIDLEMAIYGESDEDNWVCEISESPEHAKKLIEGGFEYVGDIHDRPMFRKRC